MSVGCADLLGDGNVALVNYTFTETDGQLRYTATPATGSGASADGRIAFDSDEAGPHPSSASATASPSATD